MEWWLACTLLIAILLILVFIGSPIGVGLGLASAIFLVLILGWNRAAHVVALEFFNFWSNWTLLSIPLFVLLGNFLFVGGQAKEIFDIASKWLRWLPGGLAVATIGASAIFAALTGSSLGQTATFSLIAIPEMRSRGYSARLAAGSVACAGGLAALIPPSTFFILYGIFFEQSIGQLFIAGLIPGIILAIFFIVIAMTWALAKPNSAPKEPPVSWKDRFTVLKRGGAPLLVVAAVLGTIYTGIATVTEAAALGAFVTILIVLFTGKLTWPKFTNTVTQSLKTTGFIMLIASAGKLLSWVMTYYQIPQNIVKIATSSHLSPMAFVVAMMVLYIFLGMFIDSVGMVVVTAPFVGPLLVSLGLDPIWFGVLFCVNVEVALISPPLAFNVFIVSQATKDYLPMSEVFKATWIFGSADLVLMALIIIFPQIALWLPSKMVG